jgi:hypothetical protein
MTHLSCPVHHKKADNTLIILIVYFDDYLYFATSDIGRDKIQK